MTLVFPDLPDHLDPRELLETKDLRETRESVVHLAHQVSVA